VHLETHVSRHLLIEVPRLIRAGGMTHSYLKYNSFMCSCVYMYICHSRCASREAACDHQCHARDAACYDTCHAHLETRRVTRRLLSRVPELIRARDFFYSRCASRDAASDDLCHAGDAACGDKHAHLEMRCVTRCFFSRVP